MFFLKITFSSYSCGLTIDYSSTCVCVCVFVCISVLLSVCAGVCMCVCKHDDSKNNSSRNLKFEYIVAYENILDEFGIGPCLIKVKVMA